MKSSSESFSGIKKMNKASKDNDFGDKNHCDPEMLNYLYYAKEILKNHYDEKLSR